MNFDYFKEEIVKIFPKINDQQLKNGFKIAQKLQKTIENDEEYMLRAVKLSMSDKSDILKWRNLLAEKGIECTPKEIELYCYLIRIILESL